MHGRNGTSSALPSAPLAELIDGGIVACVGEPAELTREQLGEVISDFGGQLVDPEAAQRVDLLVVGGERLPLSPTGELDQRLRVGKARRIVSESQLLYELKIAGDADAPARLFTADAVARLLKLPPQRVRAWAKAGLIRPAVTEHGIPRYDFRQASAARTLAELSAAGVSTAKLRKSLQRLRKWMPDAERPLDQLAVIEQGGELLVRLEAGELAHADGQLQMDFERQAAEETAPFQLRLVRADAGPRSASQWHEQGIDQEQHGLIAEAEYSYRQALLDGGPDAQINFDLASVLAQQGKLAQALERYRQVVEIDPRRGDAWNNLGILLADLGEHDDACFAFRETLRIDPHDAMAHYNLADTLEALGQHQFAEEHWRQFLKMGENVGPWAEHARAQLRRPG